MQKFRSNNKSEFNSTVCKKQMQMEGTQWELTTSYNLY